MLFLTVLLFGGLLWEQYGMYGGPVLGIMLFNVGYMGFIISIIFLHVPQKVIRGNHSLLLCFC